MDVWTLWETLAAADVWIPWETLGALWCLGWVMIGVGCAGIYFNRRKVLREYAAMEVGGTQEPQEPEDPHTAKMSKRGKMYYRLDAEYKRQLAEGISKPVLDLPEGMTMNDFLFPKLTFVEKIKLFFGFDNFFYIDHALENPRKVGEIFRQTLWLRKQIRDACRASKIYTPGNPNKIPEIYSFAPARGLFDGTPQEEVPFAFCLKPPLGVRASRFNDQFVRHLNLTLGGYKAKLSENGQGIWIHIPQYHIASRPPKCVLKDLGPPPTSYRLPLPLGMSNRGAYWIDLVKAPHILFAGATGSGKSTLIHACLHYLLDTHAEVWGLDLKMVELNRYRDRMARVVTDPDEVNGLLEDLFVLTRSRLTSMQAAGQNEWPGKRLVLVVDELAEVTLASKHNTQLLLRLAQIGRAAGVHLLLATQRPSVQIIPGDLKANLPLRVALALPTGVDSRVVLDAEGAEELNPPGDALVLNGHKITRISTPNYKAPPPPLNVGDDTADPRLIGLGRDARAVLVKMDGEKITLRAIKSAMRWGSDRAAKALYELRMAGLLDAHDNEEDAEPVEADVVETDVVEARKTIMALATFYGIAEAELAELSEDALAVLEVMAWEEISVRKVMKRMGWGNARALRAVRELRRILKGTGKSE